MAVEAMAGKKAIIYGYSNVGKGCAMAMRANSCVFFVTEIDPICALQVCMESSTVTTLADVVRVADICVTITCNKGILMENTMHQTKNNTIVGNIGHFDTEIDMAGPKEMSKHINTKPQVDWFVFTEGHVTMSVILAHHKIDR